MSLPPAPHVLREYALLADGHRGALIGPHGDIAWMCFPGWSDPAVFASLMGGAGRFAITPVGRHVWGGSYERGSLIWRSRWVTEDGIIESREALVFPGERDRATLLRRVIAVEGVARIHLSVGLAHDYGRRRATQLRCEDGIWRGSLGRRHFSLAGAADARPDAEHELGAEFVLEPGGCHDLILCLDGDAGEVDAAQAWRGTETAWRERVPPPAVALGERDAWHARAVLRGLTTPGGGMVAAATMSLPERADAGRAYDYRYAWVRDQAISGQAAARAGADDLLDDATAFLTERLLEDGAGLAPAYTVDGGAVPDESALGLPGYPGGADFLGNHANRQFQLDGFGESLLCLAAADERDRLDADGWRAVQAAVEAIAARGGEPDAGIWELEPAHWTHSRLICVAGLRRVAAAPNAGARAGAWLGLAERILADTSDALTPHGHWQRAPDDPRVDGALLFAALRGATPADDPRAMRTLDAVTAELCDDYFCYRFRPDARPLGEAEGAFLLCGFAMALSLDRIGAHAEAAHWFERNRGACGPPGLLSEEFDVTQRQLRGNLPQAFVHALLLECAASLRGADPAPNEKDPT
ncbi:glycoside hydrolase family 15 protein [Conexibacter sp. DBS9H8]|uniref:glycoside hydrolase family 15 protein n=1 Tax=Conexibacter sp. DBS9H8 TaxID=2937801 RepID=UPI00200CFFD9|nr:glycoside hydrolase family 15 protein [Conexibacter sp. DBS9H8]